jgi:hypothetical protein
LNKKLVFVLFVSIGNLVGSILVYYLSGVFNVPSYIALYTSILTASYTILAEPKQKTEPLLRITPLFKRHGSFSIGGHMPSSTAYIIMCIENVGYSNALNIEVKCQLTPNLKIPLNDRGIFTHSLLAPKEMVNFEVVKSFGTNELLSQELKINTIFFNEDNKKQKVINLNYLVKNLRDRLKEVKI